MPQLSTVTLHDCVMPPVGSDPEEECEDVQRPASTSQGTLYYSTIVVLLPFHCSGDYDIIYGNSYYTECVCLMSYFSSGASSIGCVELPC